ncbi:MAG: hypothetical protein A2Z86_09480 [Candidatus Glassbacteria bacterium GWA2_58_10]|uniref:FlgD Ig-like domain-containing protein n=1 Tax=Candidatus Glassbacteria bacterium GWA2_58_10 TaxID=1817865 RepID=A0A1F5YE26_9BACT|nr:MAG: hypothetical protein A2Z86_09480 [Candidatus Glassbacteria bacterium GWA2_58_10]
MRISRKLTLIPVLAALLCLAAGALYAEMLTQRVPRGNNAGMGIGRLGGGGWAGPWYAAVNNTIQFPAGSGNLIYNDCGVIGYTGTRDTDGDGTPNDTILIPDGGVGVVMLHASAYNYDEVMQIATTEPNLGRLGSVPYNRVWSSLDADELADWPVEGRIGRSASGAPNLHGAETMFVHYGDVVTTYGYGTPLGLYSGYTFHFLDYGESANMVYINVLFQNVSEYLRFNAAANYRALGERWPDGYKIYGSLYIPFMRLVSYGVNGRNNAGWAYHPAEEIFGYWCKSPTISEFNPPAPPLMGYKVLRAPSHNGETAILRNVHTDANTEFGVETTWGLVRSSLGNSAVRYRAMMGANPNKFTADRINPLTGRQLMFWPGLIEPSDQRYNQWVWGLGGRNEQGAVTPIYGEIHDLMPRDTTSMDLVFMFTPPGVSPLVAPTVDIANIDAPVMQEALAPLEHYSEVAQIVYDGGYVTPATPSAPSLTIIPGDRQVMITWSDVNLRSTDPYYEFLQQNPELDPDGLYREYDFEGYRLYRNFVGPNNSHAELVYKCSLSDNNLSFFYIDKYDNDRPYYRLRNGMRAWYALVPYDRNIDVATGQTFSLPDTASAKTWNRPGESGLYTVVPRSEASNFLAAGVDGEINFRPVAGEPIFQQSYPLSADSATGALTVAPVYLAPVVDFEFEAVIAEKITAPRSLVIESSGFRVVGTDENFYGTRTFTLTDGSHTKQSQEFQVRRRNGTGTVEILYNGPNDNEGSLYSLQTQIQYMSNGDHRVNQVKNMDAGIYTGGTLVLYSASTTAATRGGYPPAHAGQIRAGRFTLSWKDAGGGNLTLEVKDLTRGSTLNFVEYPDTYGWGLVTLDNFTTAWSGRGRLYDDMRNGVAFSARTVKMVSSLPSSNSAEFGIWVNGLLWRVQGTGGVISMPAAGTIFTLDNAFGAWSTDRKTFTQWPDPPFSGDSWKIDIKPTTIDPEDADFSKISVVPNPYVASSFLDFSPNDKRIEFINLPAKCTIRIYSLGGNLVNVLNHIGANRYGWGNYTDWDRLTQSEPNKYSGFDNHGGTEPWNMRNRYGQTVASGLYFYHVTDERGKTHTGKFYVIN